MFVVRFSFVVFALIILCVLSYLSKIDLRDLMLITSFVLIVDLLAVRFISRQYMMSIAEKIQKEEMGKHDDSSSN